MSISVSVICYKYKTLKNGECALMLRITKERKTTYQSLGVSINPAHWDFEKNLPKRNCPNRENLLRLITNKTKAYQDEILEMKIENKDFTAKSLVDKISNPTKRKTVGELFLERIQELKDAQRLGYALSHEYVYKALIKFNGHLDIYFSEIDIDWLKNFEEWQHHQGASLNTIGIRFRTLRAIYNLAIQKKYVKAEYYPFQNYNVSKLHEITPKRALSKNAIQSIMNYICPTKNFYKELAIDLFTFSYFMGGINFIDMAYLTHSQIIDKRLIYIRTKTHKTINLPLQSKAIEIIKKYQTNSNPYIFPILSTFHKNEQQKRNRIHKVISKINQQLKEIGNELNLPINITTYVARHSFATVLKRSGVSTSIISEAMGHSNEKVTQIYLDSFENEQVDAAMKNLL